MPPMISISNLTKTYVSGLIALKPISAWETVLAFVGAAVTKSLLLGALIFGTASFFVPLQILHPGWMIAFLALTAISFCLFGFVRGVVWWVFKTGYRLKN